MQCSFHYQDENVVVVVVVVVVAAIDDVSHGLPNRWC
jgi:hypothetical protein